jgi:ABC-type branched-subunit amino acid transport system substrate-binding protein
MRRTRCTVFLAAAIAVVGTVASACGSSSGSSGSTASKTGGAPIVIGTISNDTGASNSPGTSNGIVLGAKYVNAHGGIDGRQVVVDRCDEAGVANLERACALKFAADKDMDAVVYGIAREISIGLPILEQAKMPVFVPSPIGPELTTPVAFNMTGGLITTLAVFAKHFEETGVKKVTVYAVDVPTIPPIVTLLDGFLKKDGIAPATEVEFPDTTTDFTPSALAVVAQKPGAVIPIISPTVFSSITQALQSSGYKGQIATYSSSFDQAGIQAAGAAANGVYTELDFPSQAGATSASDKAFYNMYNAYVASSGTTPGLDVLHGFLAMLAMQKGLDQLGAKDISRASILKLFDTGSISGVPLLPTLTKKGAPAEFPDLANGTGVLAQIKNGQIVQIGIPTDPF